MSDLSPLLRNLDPEAPRAQRHLALVQLLDWVRRPIPPGAGRLIGPPCMACHHFR